LTTTTTEALWIVDNPVRINKVRRVQLPSCHAAFLSVACRAPFVPDIGNVHRQATTTSFRPPTGSYVGRACALTTGSEARKVAHGNHGGDVIKFTGARRGDEMLNGADTSGQ